MRNGHTGEREAARVTGLPAAVLRHVAARNAQYPHGVCKRGENLARGPVGACRMRQQIRRVTGQLMRLTGEAAARKPRGER